MDEGVCRKVHSLIATSRSGTMSLEADPVIGFLPTPYPDELLCSWIARFSERVDYRNTRALLQDVFGRQTVSCTAALPAHLERLRQSMPDHFAFDSEEIIAAHTLFPFYAPFLPPERVAVILKQMQEGHGWGVHTIAGLVASTVKSPRFFRICPDCQRQDLRTLGETYWRRSHQLPGALVCAAHLCFLEDSTAQMSHRWSKHSFEPARPIRTVATYLDSKNSTHRFLLDIARAANQLLKMQCLSRTSLVQLQQSYLALLERRGLATQSGRVYIAELETQFVAFYGLDLLHQLHCGINLASDHHWLCRLVRSPKTSQHPVRHLLLARFLGTSMTDVLSGISPTSPFGQPPWPCLNPAADHFGQSRITQVEIRFPLRARKPVGTFACDCGFIYTRRGPDRSPDDRFRRTRVKAFGPVWEERLRVLSSQQVGLRESARRMRADPASVSRHLAGQRVSAKSAAPAIPSEQEKQELLTLMAQFPDLGRTRLRQKAPALFAWLRRHARDWLYASLPAHQHSRQAEARVDWFRRDLTTVKQLKDAARRLLTKPGRSVRLTRTALTKAARLQSLMPLYSKLLPRSVVVLTQLVESREEFAIRRLLRAADELRSVQGVVRSWELIRKAGIRPELRTSPAVSSCIAKILVETQPPTSEPLCLRR